MPENPVDPIKKLFDAIKIMTEDTDIAVTCTKMSILNLEEVRRISRYGVKSEKDVQIVNAIMSWASGILGDIKDGRIRLMRVEKDA